MCDWAKKLLLMQWINIYEGLLSIYHNNTKAVHELHFETVQRRYNDCDIVRTLAQAILMPPHTSDISLASPW